MQLTPNSFRMAACMFVLYHQTFNVSLSAIVLEFFYQLKDAGRKVVFITSLLGIIRKGAV